jgi:glycosyltransferase involved in cell wall biosynthesis
MEPRQGKSYALNTAIAVSDGTLIGIVDDDEEVHPDWLNRVADLFRNPAIQYAGGRTLPTPGVVLPGWVPTCDFRAVLGWAEGPQQSCPYTPDNPAVFLMGGNAVFRAEFLRNLGNGPYNVSVGRKGRGLLTADDDMYGRVLATGAVGIYDPGLIVYHAVQPYMLTKNYYRRWCFWAAVSGGALGRNQPANVPYLLGVPRWMLRRGIESLGRFLVRRFSPNRKQRDSSFLDELYAIETAGALYGRYLFEPATSE